MRSQLAVLLPQVEVDYGRSHEDGLYKFARTDGVILGGTNELDDWSLTADPTMTERSLTEHQLVFSTIAMYQLASLSRAKSGWVDSRPKPPVSAMGGKRTLVFDQQTAL